MKKLMLVGLLSVLGLAGCTNTGSPPAESDRSSDYKAGYNYGFSSWAQPGFRSLMGSAASKTSICNYITTNAISGFSAFDGYKNQKEKDFYEGCIKYFKEQGF